MVFPPSGRTPTSSPGPRSQAMAPPGAPESLSSTPRTATGSLGPGRLARRAQVADDSDERIWIWAPATASSGPGSACWRESRVGMSRSCWAKRDGYLLETYGAGRGSRAVAARSGRRPTDGPGESTDRSEPRRLRQRRIVSCTTASVGRRHESIDSTLFAASQPIARLVGVRQRSDGLGPQLVEFGDGIVAIDLHPPTWPSRLERRGG